MKDQGVDGEILERVVKEMWWEVVDGINLARDKDLWRAVVNRVMNVRVP
jgi:hypothetical protein